MKKFVALCISVLMLICVACNETPDRLADGSVRFTAENYPKVCVTSYSEQIGKNLAVSVLGITPEEASKFITVCDTTNECYIKLIAGECDIVFAHGYGKEVTEKLNTTALELTTNELVSDALVFMYNGTGLEGMTTEQITSVYKGEVTNWSAFGGSDTSITLFGSKDGTAVQNAFQKYISADITVPPVYKTVTTENGEFKAEISYDNRQGAIGYTLFTLAGDFNKGTVKPVSVNGIVPNEETVKSGQYPLTFPLGVTIRSSEGSGNNVRVLFDWILSEQGKIALGLVSE